MNQDESITIVEMLCMAFPGDRVWATEEVLAYAKGIERLDAEIATRAVLWAQAHTNRRPSVHEFHNIYRSVVASERPPAKDEPPTRRQAVPTWVKRWVAARFLYARFGRDQDMRRFPEQGDWADPTQPLMPPEEWVKEAARVTDREVTAAVRH